MFSIVKAGRQGLQQISSATLKRNKSHMTLVRPQPERHRVPVIEVKGDVGEVCGGDVAQGFILRNTSAWTHSCAAGKGGARKEVVMEEWGET